MVRVLVSRIHQDDKNYIEAVCLSSDEKPAAGIITGSLCVEADTGNVYIFDEVGGTWQEQFSLQG